MTLFLILISAYIGLLAFVKPAPDSLKSKPLTYGENIRHVWASMLSGVFLLLVFLLTTNFTFLSVDEELYQFLALNNDKTQWAMWPVQTISHLFVHGNLLHVTGNVAALGIMSVYERRVGAKRFFSVLFVGALASTPSIFFYSENIAVCGISGGIFGLGAAYLTDEGGLSFKQWFLGILLFIVFAVILTLDAEAGRQPESMVDFRVDHIGHALGAIGAIIYCRLRPLPSRKEQARIY